MENPAKFIGLVPLLPLAAAGITSLLRREQRRLSASLAIGSMAIAFVLSLFFLSQTSPGTRRVFNFNWFELGASSLPLGFLLDPLTVVMLVMVTFISLLIFIFSVGYMADDDNFGRFFCFLSLFAAAMLGLVIANSLLLFFICWELVGLASYLLIGFWFQKPAAAAAAKKAFITTRIGDIGFFIGIIWLNASTGTLLFYNDGAGCLEPAAISSLSAKATLLGLSLSTIIALLIFCGAAGKSGQLPLHVWLPDAMEGPTPVSALIHAATMVAAGVFLVARVYPLFAAGGSAVDPSFALQAVTWTGAVTALFAAFIAVAQNDIKRILAYSTVSQLGFMMLGLGVGGVAVAMFHLITHAFFKALLFLGAGSVIHGSHHEQDIRKMGGLRRQMPITFVTYAVGMMALAGVPLFAGFWSKDEILHSAHSWSPSHIPFYMAVVAAFLTAFYMTRQMRYVFFGAPDHSRNSEHHAHESPAVMTVPLQILAACAVLVGLLGTPAWPWFQSFLGTNAVAFDFSRLLEKETITMMLVSMVIVVLGVGLGAMLYGKLADRCVDPLSRLTGPVYNLLANKLFIDELYEKTVLRFNRVFAEVANLLEKYVWEGIVSLVGWTTRGFAALNRALDEFLINQGFDESCNGLRGGSRLLGRLQNGQSQLYLRGIAVGVTLLLIALIWRGVA